MQRSSELSTPGQRTGPKSHGPQGSRAWDALVQFVFAFNWGSEEETSWGRGLLAREETEATASSFSSSDWRRLLSPVTFYSAPPPRFLFRVL